MHWRLGLWQEMTQPKDTTKCEANLHISTLMVSRYLVLSVTLESPSVFREQKCITNLIVIHLKVT